MKYNIEYPEVYHNDDYSNTKVVNETVAADGKIQRIYQNGKKEVIFANKVRRETYSDGYQIVYFVNGDIKQTFPDQKIVYFFSEAQTT